MKLKSDRVPVTKNKRGKVKGENDKVKLELENLKKLFVEDKNKICAMIKEISRHKSSKKIQKENRVSKNHEGSCLK